MKKYIPIILPILALALVTYFGVRWYRHREAPELQTPEVANSPSIAPISVADAKPGEELEIKALKVSSESEEHPATNLTDGNCETYWEGLACKTSQTITIDLGETKHFDYFYMNCPDTQRFIQMRLMGSNDGEHFDLLSERTYMQIAIGGKYNEYYDKTSGDYRYVRFFLNSDENIPEPLKLSKVALFTEAE